MIYKDFKSWLGYGKGPCHNIEHNFAYLVKLGIFTTVQLTMEFVSMFMDFVINNNVVISEIWMWICGHRYKEYYPYLHPPTFRYKGTYNKPTEGYYIRPMNDLVYFVNISALFHIFPCLSRLLERPPVKREPALQNLHDT